MWVTNYTERAFFLFCGYVLRAVRFQEIFKASQKGKERVRERESKCVCVLLSARGIAVNGDGEWRLSRYIAQVPRVFNSRDFRLRCPFSRVMTWK